MSDILKASSASIQKKWMDKIAPKYFNVEDTNLLQTGMLGYINDAMSNAVEDNLHGLGILSDEIYPNKMNLPTSIYAYASLNHLNDFYAIPSKTKFVLAMRKSDILDQSVIKNNNYRELIINRKSVLSINKQEFTFMLDYDVVISCRPTSDETDYNISARYIMDDTNEISDIITPYIKSYVTETYSEEFFFCELIGRDLEISTRVFKVQSNDIVAQLNYEMEYTGQLAGFDVFYKGVNDTDYQKIDKLYLDGVGKIGTQYCFYEFTNDNKINIKFSPLSGYFKPEFNSEIKVEIYTTNGSKGNFSYVGDDIEFLFNQDETILEQKNVHNVLSYGDIQTKCEGGKDKKSLEEIKQAVIREFSERKNLITIPDLDNYFKDVFNNQQIYFFKKRDDIIDRIYSAFTLLKNLKGEVIPSNTVNILIEKHEFDGNLNEDILTIKPGTRFKIHSKAGNSYRVDKSVLSNSALLVLDNEDYVFTCPFLIKLTQHPYFLSYYNMSVFDEYILDYSFMNTAIIEEFIINKCYIERNAVKDNFYNLKAYMGTTIDPSEVGLLDENMNFSIDYEAIKVLAVIKENDEPIGYIPMTPIKLDEEGLVQWECQLNTSDLINEDNKLVIENSLYSMNAVTETLKEMSFIGIENTTVELCIFYNGGEEKTHGEYDGMLPGLTDYDLTNIYSSQNIEIFKELNSIMMSTVIPKIDPTEAEDLFFILKDVPVIRYLYLLNNDNIEDLTIVFNEMKEKLIESVSYLKNNCNIDFKFYNTFGFSNYFNIGDSDNLDQVSIALSFDIKLSVVLTESLALDIEEYIIKYIENSNSTSNTNLYISNLMNALSKAFPEISFIEFNGINGFNAISQKIESKYNIFSNLNKEQAIKFIPEYLNVYRESLYDSEEDIFYFRPKIELNFK